MKHTASFALVALLAASGCGHPIASPRSSSAPAAAADDGDRLEVRRDGDHVTVRVRPSRADTARSDELQIVAGVTYRRGQRRSDLSTVLVGFRRLGARFRFAGCRSITLRADGVAVGTAPLRREAQIGGKRVQELVFALVPAADARRLANAARMSVTLCGQPFPISDAEHRQLRRFVARLSSVTLSQR